MTSERLSDGEREILRDTATERDDGRYGPEAALQAGDTLIVLTELDRLHSWDGLMSLLDEHWPEALHPTVDDDASRGPGPRIVSLLRWVNTYQSVADGAYAEADRLRSENTALAGRIAEVRELRRTWFQNAEVVRGKADSIPGLTEVERAELRQGAVEMETCARQVGFALGPTPEEDPQFVTKDLDRRIRLDEDGPIHFAPYGGAFTTCGEALPKNTPWSVVRGDFDTSKYTTRRAETTCPQCRAALGLVQDGKGQADATA